LAALGIVYGLAFLSLNVVLSAIGALLTGGHVESDRRAPLALSARLRERRRHDRSDLALAQRLTTDDVPFSPGSTVI